MAALAERAGGELRATGEAAVRAPSRLFISPRTAQFHLSNVCGKPGITSRSQLDRVLPGGTDTAASR